MNKKRNMPFVDRVLSKLSTRFAVAAQERLVRMQMLEYVSRTAEAFDVRGRSSSRTKRTSTPYAKDDFVARNVRGLVDTQYGRDRDRARSLEDENFLASAVLGAATNFTIGRGTDVQPMTDDERFNKEVKEFWDEYWADPLIDGSMTGKTAERVAYRRHLCDGDVGAILVKNGKLQTVEANQIVSPLGVAGTGKVVEGVRVDRFNRPTQFYVATDDASGHGVVTTPINARDFVFVKRNRRFNHVRGRSVLASQFELFDQLEGYVEGVVVAARIASLFALLIREPATKWGAFTSSSWSPDDADWQDMELSPGLIKRIGATDEVVQVKPEQPTQQFEALIKLLARFASLDLSLPLEVAMMDFSGVNYNAARAAIIMAERGAESGYAEFGATFTSRIYNWRIAKAIKAGDVRPPKKSVKKPWRHRLVRDPRPYLDVLKEIEGEALSIDLGLKLHEETLLQRSGMTYDEWLRRRVEELKKLAKENMSQTKMNKTREVRVSFEDDEETRDDEQNQQVQERD